MNEFFSSITIIILIVALILWVMVIKQMSHEIDELKEKLEQQKQFEFDKLSDCESKLYQLEEALELIEHFEKEPLNK